MDDLPPDITWPGAGSGFEADPFSPAGSAQRRWWLLWAAERGNPRARAMIAVLLTGGVVALIVMVPVVVRDPTGSTALALVGPVVVAWARLLLRGRVVRAPKR